MEIQRPVSIVFTCAWIAFTQMPANAQREIKGNVPSALIEFSHQGGLVVEGKSVDLKLTAGPTDVDIFYTVDGKSPTLENEWRSFDRPISIRKTTMVRAVAMRGDQIVARDSRAYVFVESKLADFSSNLPLVIVDAFDVDIDSEALADSRAPKRPVQFVLIDTNKKTGRAEVLDPVEFSGRAGVRVRGQTSAYFDKKSYSVELWDENDVDQDHSLLGMPAESDWILYAPWTDKSLMRNVLAFRWCREMGQYAARTRLVELFHGAEADSIGMEDYRGVYVLMEKIKRDKNRVAIAKLEPEMTAEPEISGGYIFKVDKGTNRDVHFEGAMHTFGFVEPDQPNNDQVRYLRNQIVELEKTLRSPNFADPKTGYASFLDVPSFIDVHIHVELLKNVDGFRYSAYLHKDRNKPIALGPVWDYNLSLGNAFSHEGDRSEGWYHDTIDENEYLWFARLFEDPNFVVQYWDRYHSLRKSVFATKKVIEQIDELERLLREPQARNFDRWPIFDLKLLRNPEEVMERKTHRQQVAWIKEWFRGRLIWMDEQFTNPPVISPADTVVLKGTQITIVPERLNKRLNKRLETASDASNDVLILYTTDGSDPRQSNGARNVKAKMLKPGEKITLTSSMTIKSRVYRESADPREKWGAIAEQTFEVPN